MDEFFRHVTAIRKLPPMRRLLRAASAGGQEVYLTGGALRDWFLGGREHGELDVTADDPAGLVTHLPLKEKESLFLMDEERKTYRFILPRTSALPHIDITRLRGGDIEEDLFARDFTVNALAVPLVPSRGDRVLLDPTGGRRDIEERILRVCTPRSISDDPLRALRGIRLSAGLGLSLEKKTLLLLARSQAGMRRISPERVRDELFRILQGPAPRRGLSLLLDLELLHHLGDPFRRSAAAKRHALENVSRIVALVGSLSAGSLRRHLGESLEYGVARFGLLRLAAFLRSGDGAALAEPLARHLKLGKKSTILLEKTCQAVMPRRWHRHTPPPIRNSAVTTLLPVVLTWNISRATFPRSILTSDSFLS